MRGQIEDFGTADRRRFSDQVRFALPTGRSLSDPAETDPNHHAPYCAKNISVST
jgi:hypothetical protein